MSALSILQRISDETGVAWDDESMLEILSDYIDNQGSDDVFEDFVRQRADQEQGEGQAYQPERNDPA